MARSAIRALSGAAVAEGKGLAHGNRRAAGHRCDLAAGTGAATQDAAALKRRRAVRGAFLRRTVGTMGSPREGECLPG